MGHVCHPLMVAILLRVERALLGEGGAVGARREAELDQPVVRRADHREVAVHAHAQQRTIRAVGRSALPIKRARRPPARGQHGDRRVRRHAAPSGRAAGQRRRRTALHRRLTGPSAQRGQPRIERLPVLVVRSVNAHVLERGVHLRHVRICVPVRGVHARARTRAHFQRRARHEGALRGACPRRRLEGHVPRDERASADFEGVRRRRCPAGARLAGARHGGEGAPGRRKFLRYATPFGKAVVRSLLVRTEKQQREQHRRPLFTLSSKRFGVK